MTKRRDAICLTVLGVALLSVIVGSHWRRSSNAAPTQNHRIPCPGAPAGASAEFTNETSGLFVARPANVDLLLTQVDDPLAYDELVQVMERWIHADPAAAAQFLLKRQMPQLLALRDMALAAWGAADPLRALDYLDAQTLPPCSAGVFGAVLAGLERHDVGLAFRVLELRPDEQRTELIRLHPEWLRDLAQAQPEQFIDLLAQIAPADRFAAEEALARHALEYDPDRLADWLARLPRQISDQIVKTNPQEK